VKNTRSQRAGAEHRAIIPIILGPTASGKSALAVQLALALAGEIISADSRSFYRGLDIGTDKPPLEWRARIQHHLIDVCDPEQSYNAMDFRRDVTRLLVEIRARGRMPIIVGGSTLYLRALTEGLFVGPAADPQQRHRLSQEPLPLLYERLRACDPEAARRIHANDRQRIVRALEVYELTGRPISDWQRRATQPLPERFIKIGLQLERKLLYQCIEERIEAQLQRGWLEEARALHRHLHPGMPAYKTLGYRELFQYLEGCCALDEAIAKIKTHTRQYAKRQLIWFRRDPQIHWIDVTDRSPEETIEEALSLIRAGGIEIPGFTGFD
jgi:tRNA dimethylallyltransferase